jgi:hypothetical protein
MVEMTRHSGPLFSVMNSKKNRRDYSYGNVAVVKIIKVYVVE